MAWKFVPGGSMKFIKRIFFFFSLFLLYIVAKEFLQLYSYLAQLHPYAGYGFLAILAGISIYFVFIPVVHLLRIPRFEGPPSSRDAEGEFIKQRMLRLQSNPHLLLQHTAFSSFSLDANGYSQLIAPLNKQCQKLRDRHIAQIFYTTSIAQNGFLDALLIIAISVQHVKEIFVLYNGRVSNRDLWKIAKLLYYSTVIGGSEGIEYSTNELLNKFSTDSMKTIPFLDKVITSLADGLVNAALLTRISYLTQRYCTLTYAASEQDFMPSPSIVFQSVRHITSDFITRLHNGLKRSALDKTREFTAIAINPIGYFWSKSIAKKEDLTPEEREQRKDIARLIGNPLAYGLKRLIISLKRPHGSNLSINNNI